MQTLNYEQTLELVEQFMERSGIREFCTDICQGSCCGGCYEKSDSACHKHEGRRLSCSVYICMPAQRVPRRIQKMFRLFYKAGELIKEEIRRITKQFCGEPYHNMYYKTPPPELFTEFKISDGLILSHIKEGLRTENAIIIKDVMQAIIAEYYRLNRAGGLADYEKRYTAFEVKPVGDGWKASHWRYS